MCQPPALPTWLAALWLAEVAHNLDVPRAQLHALHCERGAALVSQNVLHMAVGRSREPRGGTCERAGAN